MFCGERRIRLKVYENKVLSRIQGPKKIKEQVDGRKEELDNFFPSLSLRVIKSGLLQEVQNTKFWLRDKYSMRFIFLREICCLDTVWI
jgi:hypothetical protein